jgi:hypothetical protein
MPSALASYFSLNDATVLAAFGEPCWFYPKIGDPREVSASVDQVNRAIDGDNGDIYTEERLEILVSRDATEGIDRVALGDGFRRDTDPAGTIYSFTGEIIEPSDSAWKLAFVRRLPYQKGGNNQR